MKPQPLDPIHHQGQAGTLRASLEAQRVSIQTSIELLQGSLAGLNAQLSALEAEPQAAQTIPDERLRSMQLKDACAFFHRHFNWASNRVTHLRFHHRHKSCFTKPKGSRYVFVDVPALYKAETGKPLPPIAEEAA